MSHRGCTLALVAAALGFAIAAPAAPEPSVSATDEGRTFLYRARPGDTPTKIAEMFGVPQAGLPSLLAENDIRDPTRVVAGVVYRVPNVAARALAERLSAVERENAALAAAAAEAESRARTLARESEALRGATSAAEARAARAARLVTFWPLVELGIVLLGVLAACALHFAHTAFRAQRRAERYARALAQELDDKRKAALTERQQSGRRIVELEGRVRDLEAQLGPRVVVGGRGQ
jgi:hypothetical protein